MRVLIVGSFEACEADAEASGTVVSLRYLVKDLQDRNDVEIQTLDTGSIRRSSNIKLWAFVKLIKDFMTQAIDCDVVTLHLSPKGFAALSPFALIIAKAYKKNVIFRLFGGLDYLNVGKIYGWINQCMIKKVDTVLLQTQELVARGKQRGLGRVVWFPTSRPMLDDCADNPHDPNAQSYIYVGQIKFEKGIMELIEAFRFLGEGFALKVYGPFYDGLNEDIFKGVSNVDYGGVLPHKDVFDVLTSSKALVFPTYLPAEGYSGIILESYGAGLPVICTRWNYLPEIVDEQCGVLIKPRDPKAIVEAILNLDKNIHTQQRLSAGAFSKRQAFSLSRASNLFLQECKRML